MRTAALGRLLTLVLVLLLLKVRLYFKVGSLAVAGFITLCHQWFLLRRILTNIRNISTHTGTPVLRLGLDRFGCVFIRGLRIATCPSGSNFSSRRVEDLEVQINGDTATTLFLPTILASIVSIFSSTLRSCAVCFHHLTNHSSSTIYFTLVRKQISLVIKNRNI